jgi:hypothetical protein
MKCNASTDSTMKIFEFTWNIGKSCFYLANRGIADSLGKVPVVIVVEILHLWGVAIEMEIN